MAVTSLKPTDEQLRCIESVALPGSIAVETRDEFLDRMRVMRGGTS